MLQRIKKVKIKDLLGFFILIFAFPFALVVKIKNRKNPIWLVSELKNTCRDNGYHFFKYVRSNHPNIKCYYAINKKSMDYNKIAEYKNIIQFGSFRHWVYYLASEYNISTHKEGNPNHTVFTVVHLYLHLLNNRVFLQHGITKDNVPMFYYKNTYFKYFICGAKREYQYIKEVFGYPDENVIYTGFARFDNLHNEKVNRKKILLIPTWRRWFELTTSESDFIESEYFQRWNEFINDKELVEFLERENFELIFYPHYQMKKFIKCFDVNSKSIKIIVNDNVDIQQLLNECNLMITDYSSVYMDFAYMRKPVIYYHFDYNRYRNSHLLEGYFDYETDGFGKICNSKKEVVTQIITYCKNEFEIEKEYVTRMNDFFEYSDTKNCERIYEVLKKGSKYV